MTGQKRKADEADLDKGDVVDGGSSVKQFYGLNEGSSVLIVGDGNLSFAAALAKLGSGARLVATAYESAEEHARVFPGAAAAVETLTAAGAALAFGVDATDLAATLPQELQRLGPFDRIVFQFPQHPDRHKIHLHRGLLKGFFASATALMQPSAEIHVALCQGQGGTAAEALYSDVAPRKYKDCWKIQDAAAEARFLLRRVSPIPVEHLKELGYFCTGFRQKGVVKDIVRQEKPFNLEGSLLHVFCRDSMGAVAAHALEWRHDISFWINEAFREEQLTQVAQKVCGDKVEIELELLDSYVSPKDGRKARTYRITMRSDKMAFSSGDSQAFKDRIRADILASGVAEPRRGSASDETKAVEPTEGSAAPSIATEDLSETVTQAEVGPAQTDDVK